MWLSWSGDDDEIYKLCVCVNCSCFLGEWALTGPVIDGWALNRKCAKWKVITLRQRIQNIFFFSIVLDLNSFLEGDYYQSSSADDYSYISKSRRYFSDDNGTASSGYNQWMKGRNFVFVAACFAETIDRLTFHRFSILCFTSQLQFNITFKYSPRDESQCMCSKKFDFVSQFWFVRELNTFPTLVDHRQFLNDFCGNQKDNWNEKNNLQSIRIVYRR